MSDSPTDTAGLGYIRPNQVSPKTIISAHEKSQQNLAHQFKSHSHHITLYT